MTAGVKNMGFAQPVIIPRFAQLLAKIGLGVAVAEFGPRGFHPLVRDFIRFLPNSYRHWVGGTQEKQKSFHLHEVSVGTTLSKSGQAFLVARIRLFAKYGAPTNYVVIGTPLIPGIVEKGRPHPTEP
jgi:hypothetical protein